MRTFKVELLQVFELANRASKWWLRDFPSRSKGMLASQKHTGRRARRSTKAAVENLTQGLSAELGPRKIRVTRHCSRYQGVEAMGFLEEENAKKLVSVTPLGRLGEPSDIAEVAVFLAYSASAWVTGGDDPSRGRCPVIRLTSNNPGAEIIIVTASASERKSLTPSRGVAI